MAVVVVTTGVAATGNPGTSLVIAPSDPSAIQPGDLIIVAVLQNPLSNGNYSDMEISGFAVGPTVDFPDLGVLPWGTAWMRQRLLGKVATASEPSSYTITGIAGSDGIIAHLVALRGVDLTGGLPSNIVMATDTTAGSTITIPAITIQQAGSLDIVFVSNSGNEENPSGLTAWGGGFTELLDTALNGDWMLGGVAIATRTTAGVQPETSVQPVGDAQWGTAIRLEIPAAAGGTTYNVSLSESGSAAESISAVLGAVASLSENASAAESLIATPALVAALAEAASAADSLTAALAQSVSLTESVAASDALSAVAQLVAALSESVTASDTVILGSGQVYSVSISESAVAADALSAALTALAQLAESASSADQLSAIASLQAALTEAGSAVEALSSIATLHVSVIETGSAADALSAALTAIAQLAESATSADQLSAIASLQATVSEADGALDALSSVATLNISVIETGSAADVISGTEGEHLPSGRWIVRIAGMNRTVIVRSPNRTVH